MELSVKECPTCGLRFESAATFCQRDGSPLRSEERPTDPYIGRVLLGQFEVRGLLGAGGMGTVYRAHQLGVDRDIAIKILHPDLSQNADAVRRFQREAKVSSALDHPNLVRVILFGQLPEGSLYLAMEFLRGRSLADLLRTNGQLDVSRALHISSQVCDGVGQAHANGIVHRDIKPENIYLVERGHDPDFVKVLDFGVARFVSSEQTLATQTGLVFGTARYISPEGAAGEHTDARSDVYSIGVMTYQMLSGRAPFEAVSPVALLMKHIHETPPDLRSLRSASHVPASVADVVMRTLSKNPADRYSDAMTLVAALREAGRRVGARLSAPAWVDPRISAVEPTPVSHPEFEDLPPPRPRATLPVQVIAAFAIGAAAVVTGAWLTGRIDLTPSLAPPAQVALPAPPVPPAVPVAPVPAPAPADVASSGALPDAGPARSIRRRRSRDIRRADGDGIEWRLPAAAPATSGEPAIAPEPPPAMPVPPLESERTSPAPAEPASPVIEPASPSSAAVDSPDPASPSQTPQLPWDMPRSI